LDGRFEEYFELPKKQPDYPYVVGFKSQRTNDAELTLLLFVFDSGLIDPRMEASLYRRIAYGQITDGEITKLNKLSQTVSEGNVDDLFGTAMHITPDNTIRIALLHHHPVTSFEIEKKEEEQRRHPFKSFFAEPRKVVASMSYELTNLQGAERFVKGCFEAGIQIILFGHDHTEFRRAVFAKKGVKSPFGITTHIRTFCCPSALQISKEAFLSLNRNRRLATFPCKSVIIHVKFILIDKIKNIKSIFAATSCNSRRLRRRSVSKLLFSENSSSEEELVLAFVCVRASPDPFCSR